MFSKLKNKPSKSGSERPAKGQTGSAELLELEQTLDKILDTLNGVTRMLGRHAFDTQDRTAEEFAADCERWSRHILLGMDKPSKDDTDQEAEERRPSALPLGKRDWNGLYHFLQAQRVSEEQAVISTASTLRNLVVDSLNTFRQLLEEDQELSAEVTSSLAQLQSATENQPLDVMRDEVLHTAEAISSLIKQKNRTVDEQLEQMRDQIKAARKDILDMRREMEEDPLTGTHNRVACDQALSKLGDYAAFVQEDLALMIIDVDNLKEVNETKGHQAGDTLLRGVGQALLKAFPRKDDFIGRFGGDEFAVILSQTDAETAKRLAVRCVNVFRDLEVPWENDVLYCTVSIGVTNFNHKEDAASCASRTQSALLEAKNAGGNRCHYA